jgi:uncharacterized membrane protein
MATLDRFAPAGSRRPLILAVLVVSLVLNLFFIAGAVWTRINAPAAAPSFEERFDRIAGQLDLTPEQRAVFDRYVSAMRARSARMRQEIQPLIAAAWDEIAQPQADAGQIMQRYDDASQKWRAFQHETTAETLKFLALLSPAQRSKFVSIVRQRHGAAWLHHGSAKGGH